MTFYPIPILIPSSSEEKIHKKTIFVEIKDKFDQIKARLNQVANVVYDSKDLQFTESGLKHVKESTWAVWFVIYGMAIWFMLLSILLVLMKHEHHVRWYETFKPNVYNEIWENIFFLNYYDDLLVPVLLFMTYTVLIMFILTVIGSKFPRTIKEGWYNIEIKTENDKTTISFSIDGIDKYQLLKEFQREFPNAVYEAT